MGAIPKWAWIVFAVVAFDDIILWVKSPFLALPVTIVLILVGVVFFLGGKNMVSALFNNGRRLVTNTATNMVTKKLSGNQ